MDEFAATLHRGGQRCRESLGAKENYLKGVAPNWPVWMSLTAARLRLGLLASCCVSPESPAHPSGQRLARTHGNEDELARMRVVRQLPGSRFYAPFPPLTFPILRRLAALKYSDGNHDGLPERKRRCQRTFAGSSGEGVRSLRVITRKKEKARQDRQA